MRKLIGLLLLLCSPLSFSGEVYRWVDAQGNLVFSDELPSEDSAVTQVREINIEPIRTVPAFKPPQRTPHRLRPQRTKSSKPQKPNYTNFVITQPENGAALRDGAGNVSIETRLEPALNPDHSVVLKQDGQPIAQGSQTVFRLLNVDRGTHTITAEVKTSTGRVLISTPPTSFTMLRSSLLSPTRQTEEPSESDDAEIVELFPLID